MNIHSADGTAETGITVFDGYNRVCASGEGRVSEVLPKGLYMVRLERFGAMEEHLVIHEQNNSLDFMPPARNSAMPTMDTRHTHEYYQGPSMEYSRKSTLDEHAVSDSHVRMMVMIRARGEQDYSGIDLSAGLSLFTAAGRLVSGFEDNETVRDSRSGWRIYSEMLPPGGYLLVLIVRDVVRFLPVRLYPGWDSFIFLPYEQQLRLTQASLDMVPAGSGFEPGNSLTMAIDGALKGLGERLDLLPEPLRMEALYGKFEHPLLGLVGAHAHFMGKLRKERLEEAVLNNLWSLLPDSPDVIALLIMALEHDHTFPDSMQALQEKAAQAFGASCRSSLEMEFPPMLRSGLRALVRASGTIPDIIKAGSWLEAAALNDLAAGSAWTVWDQELSSVRLVLQLPEGGREVPGTQHIYSSVKRAIATHAGVLVNTVRANDKVGSFFPTINKQLPDVLHDIAVDLGGIPLDNVPRIQADDQVRDVMRKFKGTTHQSRIRATGVTPQTAAPVWLLDFAREALEEIETGEQPDFQALAFEAGVPLRQLLEAVKTVQKT